MPAGRKSLHKEWHSYPDRTFDLITLVYDDEFTEHAEFADFSFRQDGTKTQLLAWFFENHPEIWEQYDYFWLADDDLALEPEEVNRLFDLAEEWQMPVCQPSLTSDSPHSHAITLHREPFLFREVSFVEVMCPMFSKAAIQEVIPYFKESESAWGVDEIWSQVLFPKGGKYIIDAIQVHHTKKIGKPERGQSPDQGEGFYANISVNPYDELNEMAEKYGFTAGKKKKNLGAVDLQGNKLGKWRTNWLVKKDRARNRDND
jgi:hypothetical protein